IGPRNQRMLEPVTELTDGEQSIRERWVDCDGVWVHTADWEPDVVRAHAGRSPPLSLLLDLIEKFQADRGPALVMGNSMGGSLAVALAANHPEHVSGLVLVNAALPRPRGQLDPL